MACKCEVPYRPTAPLAGLGASQIVRGVKTVTIGPIAKQLHDWRIAGVSPQLAMHQMLALLAAQGHKVVTPEIRDQLVAGMQKFPGVKGLSGLGFSSAAAGTFKAASTAATVAPAAGSAIGLGATIGGVAIPVVGAVIGAAIGAIILFGARHVGKAEAAWTAPGFYASLNTTAGRDYDEHQFSEAFKGMLDTGNNIVPGCGPDRHKNPDCLLGPMADVIANGYLSNAVPLTATTQQVFSSVVIPWLQSGAGGLVNWSNLSREQIQQNMLRAATDRYLAGQAMTRGDMPSYGNQGAHTIPLVTRLQPLLQQQAAPVAAPTVSSAVPYAGPSPVQMQAQPLAPGYYNAPVPMAPTTPVTITGTTSTGSPIVPPDQTAALIAQLQAQGASQQAALQAAIASLQAQGVPPQQAQQIATADLSQGKTMAGFGAGLPQWALYGIAALGLGFVFFRQGKGGRSKRYG